MWGDARNSYNAPSRRKKKRKKYIFLDDQFNPGKKLKIPYLEYPAPMIFYAMNTAGLLNGKSSHFDSSDSWQLKCIMDEAKLQNFVKKYPGQLTVKFTNSPNSFARLLAKIGYGNALCSLDPDDFNPICVPYILGQRSNLSYIVGSRGDIPAPVNKNGYSIDTHVYGTSTQLLIMAEIRLIANNHTPFYHVVVGSVEGKEAVSLVLNKIKATGYAIIPDGTKGTQTPSDEHHWMPRIWPPPI